MNRPRFLPGLILALSSPAVLAQAAPNAPPDAARGFNPKISLILSGTYSDYSSDAEPEVPGVLLGPETEPAGEGFSLGESELVIEANVDDQFHGWASVALEDEDGETVVAVEEAYIDTLALPAGLTVKAGRFFSELGYQNHIHGHAWDFVDLPLPYRALLAGQLNDDGVQLRWVAPTDLFVELGAEALAGRQFPGGGESRGGARSFVGFVHLGGDIGSSQSWRAGLSHLKASADGRVTGEEDAAESFGFTGDSDLTVVDLVWKWARNGNPADRSLVLQAEYFFREEEGAVAFDGDTTASSGYEGSQDGFYAQAVFQFIPRWRAGVRYDRLEPDNTLDPGAPEFDTLADDAPASRWSTMLDFSNSEFSRLRLQYTRDESRPADEADDRFYLQYIVSLGAHPAHQF